MEASIDYQEKLGFNDDALLRHTEEPHGSNQKLSGKNSENHF